MPNPKNFEPHSSLSRKRAVDNLYRRRAADQKGHSSSISWLIAAGFVVVMVGLFAVSYRPTRVASHAPPTTLGESSRPSVPVPVAPNQQP
jgi:hypothetical protein